jgi:hypothetical protein
MEMEVEMMMMMMMMAAVRIMSLPVDAPARLGATVTGPARRPDALTAQFASNIPATLPWPYSRCLDFVRTEKRLAARAPQTAGRYLSPATRHWGKLLRVGLRPLGLQQLRQLGDVDRQESGLIKGQLVRASALGRVVAGRHPERPADVGGMRNHQSPGPVQMLVNPDASG